MSRRKLTVGNAGLLGGLGGGRVFVFFDRNVLSRA